MYRRPSPRPRRPRNEPVIYDGEVQSYDRPARQWCLDASPMIQGSSGFKNVRSYRNASSCVVNHGVDYRPHYCVLSDERLSTLEVSGGRAR
jgi:hypothetical protein